jgi:uncharacterized membrane protein YdjX (TVP38/TMEM64 family)
MIQSLGFLKVAQNVVLEPTVASMFPLFLFSFINDLTGLFPFALAIAGQLLFIKQAFTLAFAAKLLVFVAVPVGVGSALGSVPLYLVAYYGGKPVINKLRRYIKFSWEDVEKVKSKFSGTWYDEIIFLLLRCTPVLPSFPMDVAGGILQMRFLPFFVLTIVGSIIRMMITLIIFGIGMQGLSQL